VTPPEGAGDEQENYQAGHPPARDVEIGVDRHPAPGADVLGLGQLQAGQFDVLRIASARVGGSPPGIASPVADLPAFRGRNGTGLARTGQHGTALIGTTRGTAFRGRGWRGEFLRSQGLAVELVQCGYVSGDRFFFVQAQILGVGADEAFVEDAAGELVEVLLFDGSEHARADLGGVGNILELDALALALFAEFVAELSHAVPQSDLTYISAYENNHRPRARAAPQWERGNGVLAVTVVRGRAEELGKAVGLRLP